MYNHITKDGKVIQLENRTKNVIDTVERNNRERVQEIRYNQRQEVGARAERAVWEHNRESGKKTFIAMS